MELKDFDYDLPDGLIAQEPTSVRDSSRLMIVDPGSSPVRHGMFRELPGQLRDGDLLVLNNTKVFPARLIGKKEATGGEVEIFLLTPQANGSWEALSRPARRINVGTTIVFGDSVLTGDILEKRDAGKVIIRLASDQPLYEAIDAVGETPLPPYIKRHSTPGDRDRYQTVYASVRGAVAAPTAGLHFTESLLEELAERGIQRATVTLHVGIGTFRPLEEEDMARPTLHSEYCDVSEETVDAIRSCRDKGGRVIAVGTTTARALESASQTGVIEPFSDWTRLFIKPPYTFKTVDALITNFHLPRSSLLMMVSAFAGRDKVLAAYQTAIEEQYRFYSYGDAMLIWGNKS